jgi:hypothetical protein
MMEKACPTLRSVTNATRHESVEFLHSILIRARLREQFIYLVNQYV